MGSLFYAFLAYSVIWLALLAYSFSLAARQKSLEREVETIKAVLAEKAGIQEP